MNSRSRSLAALLAAVFLAFANFAFGAFELLPQQSAIFSGSSGAGFFPPAVGFSLKNNDATPATWSAASSASWLSIAPSSGTLAAGATAQLSVSPSLNVRALEPGLHVATITFSDGQTRRVAVDVDGAAATLFEDQFEDGTLGPQWTSGSARFARVLIQSAYPGHIPQAHSGRRWAALMTSYYSSPTARSEITLSLNLVGRSGVALRFWAMSEKDLPDGPPASPFVNGADFDGVAVSTDGTTWYEIQSLRGLREYAWTEYVVDLDASLAAHGLAYGPNVRIRFSRFGNDGNIGLDDVRVAEVVAKKMSVELPGSPLEGTTPTGTVSVFPVQPVPTTVSLHSEDDTVAGVPETVTIPANASSASFPITLPVNGALTGTRHAFVTAGAVGFRSGSATLSVRDSHGAAVSLSFDGASSVNEGGSLRLRASLGTPATEPVVVEISSSSYDLYLPQTATIPAGESTVDIYSSAVSDFEQEGTETVVITAKAGNGLQSSVSATIGDTSPSPCTLSRNQEGVSEGSANHYVTASFPWRVEEDTVVTLSSSDASELTVPASVTIRKGSDIASFYFSVADDVEMDGTKAVTITGVAAGYPPATTVVSVEDNDVHHLSITNIATPTIRNAPFAATISALSIDNKLCDVSGPVTLSLNSPSGAVPVSPASVTLVGGKWSGELSLGANSPSAQIVATFAIGLAAGSNPVAVISGTLNRLAVSTPATVSVDQPFSVTVSAVDEGENLISSYNGPISISATAKEERAPAGIASASPNYYGFGFDDYMNRIQSIYLPSEVHGAGKLQSLGLNFTQAPNSTYQRFVVRLKHVPASLTEVGSYQFDADGWTEVFRGDVEVNATGWKEITFATPFDYNGESNLMVDLSFLTQSVPGSRAYFEIVNTAETRTLYVDYPFGYDPLSVPYFGFVNDARFVPNVRFSTEEDAQMRGTGQVNLVNGTWTGVVSLPSASERVRISATDGAALTGKSAWFRSATAALGPGVGLVAKEDWEAEVLSSAWKFAGAGYPYYSNVQNLAVSSSDGPHGGSKHLAMDRSASSAGSSYRIQNEATWTNDLTGLSGLTLKFWAKSFGEVPDAPLVSPLTQFPDHTPFDGVAISADGQSWNEVRGLRNLSTSWFQYSVDLDAAIKLCGLSYGPGFKIRFNQSRTSGIAKGITIDDIELFSTPRSGAVTVTLPPQMTEGTVHTASVNLPFAVGSNVPVTLAFSAPAKALVPSTVTIPAGQTSTQFSISVLNDSLADGLKVASLQASATGFQQSGSATLLVDNDLPSFTMSTTAASLIEKGTPTGTLTIPLPAAAPLTFSLMSSDTTEITVPQSVTINIGQTSANFRITALDDVEIDGTQSATITASISGLPPQTLAMTVLDNETAALGMTPATASVAEGGAHTITVSLSGTVATATTISFTSSSPRVTAPSPVAISAGTTSATATFLIAQNTVSDGDEVVTLTASGPGFQTATCTLTALDNDPHHFDISAISSPQIRGADFPVTITARSASGVLLAGYSGPATLTGTALVSPDSISLTGGIWTGNIRVSEFGSNVVLTVSDGAGQTGTSNAFDVTTGTFSEFQWTPLTSPQFPAKNLPISFSATDAGGNLVTTVNEPVTVRALAPSGRTVIGGTGYSATTFLSTTSRRARSETIFLASELGAARLLGGVSWRASYVTSVVSLQGFTVRLKATSRTAFVSGDEWDSDGWTTVHRSTLVVTGNGAQTIYFDAPFPYDGQSNLMVDVSFENPESGDYIAWIGNYDGSYMTLSLSTNTGGADNPLLWTGSTGFGSSFRVQTTFLGLEPSRALVTGPSSTTAGIWNGSVMFPSPQEPVYIELLSASGRRGISAPIHIRAATILPDPAPLAQVALPVSIPENGAPASGTVTLHTAAATSTIVALESSSPVMLGVPAQVSIPAGQTSATFAITPGNDSLNSGPLAVSITASIDSVYAGRALTSVLDDEARAVVVSLPASIDEDRSSATGTVSLSFPTATPVVVSLVSSNPAALSVPSQVAIPAWQTTATFQATAPDDNLLTGNRTVTVSATSSLGGSSADILVVDEEKYSLSLQPFDLFEGLNTTPSISIAGIRTVPTVVSLSCSNPSRLSIPTTATIPAGVDYVAVQFVPINNTATDGRADITITATSPGFGTTSSVWTLRDKDLHHFSVTTSNSPKFRGTPFTTTVTPLTIDGDPAEFTGTISLSTTGDAGTINFSPGTSTSTSISTTVNTASNNVRITATSGSATGISAPFNVVGGPATQFSWTAIPTSQTAGKPFPATLIAADIAGTVVPGYTGFVRLSGISPERMIGSGTATGQSMPLGTNSHDARSQIRYLQSELGTAVPISSLSLYIDTPPGQTLNSWTIRMLHGTTQTDFLGTGWTTVYSANETISTSGWKKFDFTTPFNYDGTNSLYVDLSFNNTSASTAGAVRTFTGTAGRTAFARTDSLYGDPKNWRATPSRVGPSPSISGTVPQIIFNQGAISANPPVPSVVYLLNGTWTGFISFPKTDIGSAKITASDFDGLTGSSNTITLSAAADADTDKLPDWWETANSLVPSNSTGDNGAAGDLDKDGISNLLEFALASNPRAWASGQLPTTNIQLNPADGQRYLTFSYSRRTGNTSLIYAVETSSDCAIWSASGSNYEQLGAAPLADGASEMVTVRVLPALTSPASARFVRLRVTGQ